MTFSTVWTIGGAAQTGEDAARLLAHFATGGREGVLDPLACRVLALDTPGPGFKVMPGPFAVKARGVSFQSYLSAVTEADVTSGLAGTGSSGGRHDLVTLRIIDPVIGGTGDDVPADPARGPYAIVEVLTGVPFGTKAYAELGLLRPAIAVARIEYPPSTATITQAMIKDLRGGSDAAPGVAPIGGAPLPAPATFVDSLNCTSGAVLPHSQSAWVKWPGEAAWNVPVPPWATEVAIYATINPTITNTTTGYLRLLFNGRASSPSMFDVNMPAPSVAGNPLRTAHTVGGRMDIPPAERGKVVPVQLQGSTLAPGGFNANGSNVANQGTVLYLSLAFKQGAVAS